MEPLELPNILLYAVPFFVISLAAEWFGVAQGYARGKYTVKDAITSITMGMGNLITVTVTAGIASGFLSLAYQYRVFEFTPNLINFLLVFIFGDFIYYWKHRAMHRVRWFWMEHTTHHSSTHYNLSTALRQPWFGHLTGLFVMSAPLAVLGFHPGHILLAGSVNLLYQFWIHTEAIDRMPRWFEVVMNTPSHHRVHHATNPKYLDANYAGVFIIWDKVFGSFEAEDTAEPCQYGIVKPVNSYNPFWVAYHEFVALLTDCWDDGLRLHHWLKRLVNPPGWSPDGQHNRTEEIKARAGLLAKDKASDATL